MLRDQAGLPPGETVLVVEDDAGVAILQRRQLERAGYRVLTAATADEAIEATRQNRVDLAILDYRLPGGITGLDLHARFKAAGHEIPVIMVTGFSDEATAIQALRAGVRDFVSKSVEYLDYLPEAVTRALAHSRLKDELRRSEERFRLIAGATSDWVWDWHLSTGEVWWSEGFSILFGHDDPPSIEAWSSKLHPGDRERVLASIQAAIDGRAQSWSAEYRFICGDERSADVAARASILRDSAGRAIRMVGSCTDVTERKRTEGALRQKEAELRQAQKLDAVGQLAGGLAHEFNNLLQAIFSYTQFAMDALAADHPACEDLTVVEKAAHRAATLTRQLLSFSRQDVLRRTDFCANTAVEDFAKMLRPLIGADIELRTELRENVGTIRADSGLLQQALLNLCINARDAMPGGGQLTIRTESVVLDATYCELYSNVGPGRYLVLTVSDTGSGMPPDVQSRIFEPFFTTKEVGKGTGLGLSFVYGVVEQHGGAIHVYSEPGLGTTFRIYLPNVPVPGEQDAAAPRPAAAGGTETILVADDEPFVRDVATRVLERAGYTVLTAVNGEDAIRRFSKAPETISLVLLDVVMPKGSGDKVYERIRELNPNVAVVFCSGYDPDTKRTEFVLRSGLPLLQKPFVPQALLRAVREQLDAKLACAAT